MTKLSYRLGKNSFFNNTHLCLNNISVTEASIFQLHDAQIQIMEVSRLP